MWYILLIAFSVFFILVLPFTSFADEAWFACQSDTDCVQVGSGCALTAVNKTFQAIADKFYKELNTRIDCSAPINASGPVHPACHVGKDACKLPDGRDDPASTCAVQSCILVPDK